MRIGSHCGYAVAMTIRFVGVFAPPPDDYALPEINSYFSG
jgi:hypothetical protein